MYDACCGTLSDSLKYPKAYKVYINGKYTFYRCAE